MKNKLLLIFVLSFALLFSACSDKDDEDQITISMVTTFGSANPATEFVEKTVEDFDKEHPNVTIDYESGASSTEFNTKLQTRFSSGDVPDMTFFFLNEKGEFIWDSDKVVSMEPILEDNPEWASEFDSKVLDQVKEIQGGEIKSIPLDGYYEGLIVNKQMFDEEGLELPETWEQFETAIKKFAETDIIPITTSLGDSPYLLDQYTLAAGGVAGHKEPYSDAYVEGLKILKETYEWGAYSEDALTIDNPQSIEYYKNERAAMHINGSWVLTMLSDELAENTTILPMPVAPNGELEYGNIISGFDEGWHISEDAYNDENKKEVVLDLLKSLSDKNAVENIAGGLGNIPSKDVEISGLNPAQEDGMKIVENAEKLEPAADSFIPNEPMYRMRDYIPQVVTGEEAPEQTVKEAKKLDENY